MGSMMYGGSAGTGLGSLSFGKLGNSPNDRASYARLSTRHVPIRAGSKDARGASHAFGEVDGIRQHLDYTGSVLSIFINVEPRGFEPLTSAVQSQIHNILVVRYCSEMPAKLSICLWKHSWLFVVVRVGWCTTGVYRKLADGVVTARSTQCLNELAA